MVATTTWATSVCDKDIDDGITLEKHDDEKTQSKQRLCDRTCKTFDHSGTLDDDGKEHIVLGARSPKGQD